MNLRNTEAVANWARVISQETYSALKQGALPIVAGGDHSVSFGSVNGVARYHREQGNELFVLWLDAHADFNTPAISPTGNAHGMSAAFACGEPGLDEIIAREERVSIEPQNLFLFGTRWIDPKEQVLLGERSVNVFDMNTLDMSGVPLILSRIINTVKAREGVLHVSFDLDLLDPETAPGVGTPEAGGIAFREARLIMEMLHDSGLVGSIDLVELNPLLDHRNSSAKVLVELVCSLFGHKLFDPSAESLTREGAASERYGR
jgi:arginase